MSAGHFFSLGILNDEACVILSGRRPVLLDLRALPGWGVPLQRDLVQSIWFYFNLNNTKIYEQLSRRVTAAGGPTPTRPAVTASPSRTWRWTVRRASSSWSSPRLVSLVHEDMMTLWHDHMITWLCYDLIIWWVVWTFECCEPGVDAVNKVSVYTWQRGDITQHSQHPPGLVTRGSDSLSPLLQTTDGAFKF